MIKDNLFFKLAQATQFLLGLFMLFIVLFGSPESFVTGFGLTRIRMAISDILIGNIRTAGIILMNSGILESLVLGVVFVIPFMKLDKKILIFYTIALTILVTIIIQPISLLFGSLIMNFLPILVLLAAYTNTLFIMIYLIKKKGKQYRSKVQI